RQVGAAEVLDRVARQEIALAVPLVRRGSEALVGRRVDEQLELDRGSAGIACQQTDGGRKVAPGAVAAHREAANLQLVCVLGDMAGGGEAIVDRSRERVL